MEEEESEDSPSNQKWVLAPRSQDTDVTLILNKLLREYDKKLRPDIGSEYPFCYSDTKDTLTVCEFGVFIANSYKCSVANLAQLGLQYSSQFE